MKLGASLVAEAALGAMLVAATAAAGSPTTAARTTADAPPLPEIYIGVQQRGGPKPGAYVYFAPSSSGGGGGSGASCRTAWLAQQPHSPCGRRFDATMPDGRVERGLALEGCDALDNGSGDGHGGGKGGKGGGVWLSQNGRRVAASVRDATPRAGCPQIHAIYACRA
jgi:hypothetical protein